MTILFSSDGHWGHVNILKLCQRPFPSIVHMNEELVRRWNEKVSPEDTVYYLGDAVLGNREENLSIIARLNGTIYLCPGNHDKVFDLKMFSESWNRWTNLYLQVFEDILDAQIQPHRYWPLPNTNFVMSHFPYQGDSGPRERYTECRPVDNGRVLLHGHRHSKTPISYTSKGTPQYDVGVDANGFAPVSLNEIMTALAQATQPGPT